MNEWQGRVIPPYKPDALPLIDPWDVPDGYYRAYVIGGDIELWGTGSLAPSVSSGPACESRSAALELAQLRIQELESLGGSTTLFDFETEGSTS